MHTHPIDNRHVLPMRRQADAERRDYPSGTGVVLAVLLPLLIWAFLAALGAAL